MGRLLQARDSVGADPDSDAWHSALVAQLHYDRSDVAQISPAAAAAMDVVISLTMAAIRHPNTATLTTGESNTERH